MAWAKAVVAHDQARKAASEDRQARDDTKLTLKEGRLGPDLPPYTPPRLPTRQQRVE